METDDERSTAVVDLVTALAQGVVLGGIVLICMVVLYFIVEVGQ
jgi:hypothetical protein